MRGQVLLAVPLHPCRCSRCCCWLHIDNKFAEFRVCMWHYKVAVCVCTFNAFGPFLLARVAESNAIREICRRVRAGSLNSLSIKLAFWSHRSRTLNSGDIKHLGSQHFCVRLTQWRCWLQHAERARARAHKTRQKCAKMCKNALARIECVNFATRAIWHQIEWNSCARSNFFPLCASHSRRVARASEMCEINN